MFVFHFLEIMLIKRAVPVDTFVDAEELSGPFSGQGNGRSRDRGNGRE